MSVQSEVYRSGRAGLDIRTRPGRLSCVSVKFVDVSSSVALSTLQPPCTTMSMSTLYIPRIIDVADACQQHLTLDTAKDCLLVYFFARRALKLFRHVRGRGFIRSIRDLYLFIAQVCDFPPLSLHPMPRLALENPSSCYFPAVYAQTRGHRTRRCEGRHRPATNTAG